MIIHTFKKKTKTDHKIYKMTLHNWPTYNLTIDET